MQRAVNAANQTALFRKGNSVIFRHPMRIGAKVFNVGVFAVEIRALFRAKVVKFAASWTVFGVAAAVFFPPSGAVFAAIFGLGIVAFSFADGDAAAASPRTFAPSRPVAPAAVDAVFVMRQIDGFATASPTPHSHSAFAAIGPRHVMRSTTGVLRASGTRAPQPLAFGHIRTDFTAGAKDQFALHVTIVQFSRQHFRLLIHLILPIGSFHGRSVCETLPVAFIQEIRQIIKTASAPTPWMSVVIQCGRHDVILPVATHVLPTFEIIVVRHVEDVTDLVGDGERRRQTRIFADGATASRVAHGTQLGQAQRVAFADGPTDVFSRDENSRVEVQRIGVIRFVMSFLPLTE